MEGDTLEIAVKIKGIGLDSSLCIGTAPEKQASRSGAIAGLCFLF